MTDKRFYNGIELKNSLLYFKDTDCVPTLTSIIEGYNTILKENEELKRELQQYKDKHKKWVKECKELHKDFEKDWKRWGRM